MDALQIIWFLIASVAIIIYFFNRRFQYWKERNVPHLPPKIPYGHATPFFGSLTSRKMLEDTYKHFRERGEKHCGIYTFFRPVYMPLDLEYLKNILAKDFQHFATRGMYCNEKADPMTANLLSLDGESWRNLRVKLTPTFTSGKMKNMFPIFTECAMQMVDAISRMVDQKQALDAKDIMGSYTTDVIGNCAFGLNCNSFQNAESEFRIFGKRAIQPRPMLRLFVNLFTDLCKKIGVRVVHPEVSRFFINMVQTTLDYRERNGVYRNDFLQILLDLKNREGGLTVEQIAANSFLFFLAGFDTSATTMNFALYELSKNEKMQEKARGEILDVLARNNNELTYDSLKGIKYLDQIIDETLRMYAPAPLTARSCTKDYRIPNTNTIIEKGTRVVIPIYLIHMDGEYYDNPEEFNPERFSEGNKPKIPQYAFIPFGEGPRICIGTRFGQLQTKVGLTLLLKNYKFYLNPKTVQPLTFNSRSIILATVDPIYLDAEKIV